MPNHVTNRLRVVHANEERVKEVLAYLKSGESQFIDFNKIIPMPEELNIDSGSTGINGMKYILELLKITGRDEKFIKNFESQNEEQMKESISLGEQYLSNIQKYGYPTWYEWRNFHWGTKWNAYDQSFEEQGTIWFNTAWSGVSELIGALSIVFSDVDFYYTFADEDTGCNTGDGIIKNGDIDMYYPECGSSDAFHIAFELCPGLEQYYDVSSKGYYCKEVE